jgi:CubicO group peptidase (beta-lactamase class C family)
MTAEGSSQTSPTLHLQVTRLRERAISILEQAVTDRVFPGAAFAVTRGEKILITGSAGRFTCEPDSPAILPETVFDLASVTKVVATTAMAMILYDRDKLDLNGRVVDVIREFGSGDREDPLRRQVTFRMLLAHSSGLPAYARLFEQAGSRDALLQAIYAMPLAADPDTRAEYSDIGFILLGEALSRLAGEPLDEFCQREIFSKLEMKNTTYLPSAKWKSRIPPTVDDRTFRQRVIQGEVNDENASVLGGVSAHAGVFANVEDVSKFALCVLGYGLQLYRRETIRLFTTPQRIPAGTSRALGWDTPSVPSQSGQYFSANSCGHLGYTGTSLWIDMERRVSITLLTNRTWPHADNQAIKHLRPKFHDEIMEELLKFQ